VIQNPRNEALHALFIQHDAGGRQRLFQTFFQRSRSCIVQIELAADVRVLFSQRLFDGQTRFFQALLVRQLGSDDEFAGV
jgi:hypothetical protein